MIKNKKQTLYIVDASIDITGAFFCIKNEAKLLKDIANIVLVLPKNSKIKEDELKVFTKVVYLPIVNIKKSFFSIIAYIPFLIYSGWKLKKIMKRDDCSRLQINDFYLMQGVVSKIFGFKGTLVTWVRIDPRRYGSFLSKYWLKFAYKYSDTIVANSKFIKDILPKSFKNILIYDPIYIREEIEYKTIHKDTDVKKVVYIANYIQGKGQQYAIEAFMNIKDKFPEVELHFYGGNMGLEKNKLYLKELKEMAKDAEKIYFHGFVNDIKSVLKSAYIALNFSDSESFSLTVLEASYYGVPVIATKSGGPQEIIVDSKTGLLVNIGNIQEIQKAIKTILLDKQLAKSMRTMAKEHIIKKFSSENFRKNISKVLELKGKENQ
jgi:glycosyltransferase involved in cell wall biosynthesis